MKLLKSQLWQCGLKNRALPCLQVRWIEAGLLVGEEATCSQLYELLGEEALSAEELRALDVVRWMQEHVLGLLVLEEVGAQHQPLEGLGKK